MTGGFTPYLSARAQDQPTATPSVGLKPAEVKDVGAAQYNQPTITPAKFTTISVTMSDGRVIPLKDEGNGRWGCVRRDPNTGGCI